ncbi:MAG TPA: AMP-binding protein, partial [Acidimicrobiales bacterium]|nr:AMP-binding protein [Acidimicrobiales bacterium]
MPWAQLHDEARAMAAAMQARGVSPGDHVALLGPTTRPLVTAVQAGWLAGAAVVVLPLPMRLGSLEEFVAQTRARMASADITLAVVDPDLAPFIEPVPGDPPMVLLSDLANGRVGAYEEAKVGADDLAVLQFTSGST